MFSLQREKITTVYKLASVALSTLKMLALYLDTLIIGPKFCSMLSIQNELPLQQEFQNVA